MLFFQIKQSGFSEHRARERENVPHTIWPEIPESLQIWYSPYEADSEMFLWLPLTKITL